MKHLQQLAPDMFAMIERADDSHLRMVCVPICELAVRRNRPFESVVDEALECLRLERRYEQGLVDRLDALMNRFDDQYFELKDQAEDAEDDAARQRLTAEYQALFQKARTVAALRASGDPDAFEAATEAIYEAAASVADKESIFNIVKQFLRA